MKILIISALCVSLCHADAATSQESKQKVTTKTTSSYSNSQKPEYVVQPVQQTQQQYYPVQYLQKPYYLQQQPQTAMVIIAQPAFVPQHVLYSSQMQQLLNYFHNNPQARYQLLHGYQPQQSPQPYITHNSIASPSIGNYQIVPAPHLQQYVPASSQVNFAQASHLHQQPQPGTQYSSIQPMHINDIAQLAQFTAQSVSSVPSLPFRAVPAIVTGFENFTPDQQAQIKAQLSAHFGSQLSTPASTTGQQHQVGGSQYPRYATAHSQNDFLPSSQVKTEAPTTTSNSYSPTDIYRSQYSKG